MLLDKVAGRGRTLFRLFQHPSMTIVKGAGLVMKAIIEEGEDEVNIDKLFNVWIIMKVITSGWLQDARACPGRGGPAPASPVCSVHPVS